MIQIQTSLRPANLLPAIERAFELSANKLHSIEKSWDPSSGTPVFTRKGRYHSRGWTEWTRGFQFGSAILQFDATGDDKFLQIGRKATISQMAAHLTHTGVHDHGFNNVSTYGNLLRLMNEGRIPDNVWERRTYELALKVSGAVQASRWTELGDDCGYIYSFNGPHSLFADTVRSLRSLAISHKLGHVLLGENDRRISLLQRMLLHLEATATYSVYFGNGRDHYDVAGRVAHESIFNVNDAAYRCPGTQQGYSPFSTWTRGLAWIILGYAEQIEFFAALEPAALSEHYTDKLSSKDLIIQRLCDVAVVTAEFYLANSPSDGIPYWDTGAPGLNQMGDYLNRPADPFNKFEPVDSSAACIAAQGLIRLGQYFAGAASPEKAQRYEQAGLTIAGRLFQEPYLAESSEHQGLILHSVYHRPNGWDAVSGESQCPNGESTMWGDYHARELALLVKRMAQGLPYYAFGGAVIDKSGDGV